jgi:uncharacterized membrane protein YjjP (DUF1212 family)
MSVSPSESEILDQLLTELPRALSAYGTPAHRLEEAMGVCAEKLGVPADFFSMPTAVLCSIGAGEALRTHIVRVQPGQVDLEKLDRVDAVLGRLLRQQISPGEALATVRAIERAPARYPAALVVACYGAVAAGAAQFFGGAWVDALAALTSGLIVGLFGLFAARRRQLSRLTEFASGLVAAGLAGGLVSLLPGLTPGIVIIASLIVLIPGLTLTVAVNELATRNLVSGTARLMGALMILLSIGFGVGLGQAVAAPLAGFASMPTPLLAAAPAVPVTPMPAWTQFAAILLVPCALAVLFRARPRDMLVIVPAAAIGYYGARSGAAWLGPELGAWVGALAVGVFANGVARLNRRPTAITLVPGIMLLVPGAIGFRSISSFLAQDALAGVQTAFTVAIIATAIVTGLLLANVLVRPRQSL